MKRRIEDRSKNQLTSSLQRECNSLIMLSNQGLSPYLTRTILATAFFPLLLLIACHSPEAYSLSAQNESRRELADYSGIQESQLPQVSTLPAQQFLVAGNLTAELYNRATLEYWQKRYSRSTQRILEEGLMPTLSSQELQALRGVQLAFPLRSADLMGFYASFPPSVVTMPVESLKLLDDLCTAYAWLWANNYRLETVEEYVAMLRYKQPKDFPGGRYPKPLEALGIPANALEAPQVDELSLRFFNSARAFILAHELAHIRYRHRGGVVQDEAQADRFALDVLSRTKTIPMGIILYFQAMAHWMPNRAQFPNEAAWQQFLQQRSTHPITADRIRAIAQALNEMAPKFVAPNASNRESTIETVRFIANGLQPLVTYLEEPEIQLCVGEMAAKADVTSIRPRRSGKSILDCN